MLIADRDGALATTVVSDWVLDHLDRLDPEGDFLSVPAAQSPCGGSLASVTRLPVMSGMSDAPGLPEMSAMAAVPSHHAATASVIPLRVPVGADD